MDEPPNEEKLRVFDRMHKLFGQGPQLPQSLIDFNVGDLEFQSLVRAFMLQVNPDASPGCPYSSLGGKNSEVLKNYPEYIFERVMARLKLLLTTTKDLRTMTPEELVLEGFCDPVRVFVKNEPHKIAKIKAGRVRLISSVSLVDGIIGRVLCTTTNKFSIANWMTLPAKPGMGFDYEDNEAILNKVFDGKVRADLDAEAYDWSLQEWLMLWDADFRASWSRAFNTPYHNVLVNRTICLTRSVFMTSDGRLFAQRVYGIQKSGDFNTSSTNSNTRTMACLLVDPNGDPISMGDDGVDLYLEGAPELYFRKCGMRIKAYNKIVDEFEFCSHTYHRDGRVIPINLFKMLMRYVHQDASIYPMPEFARFCFRAQFENEVRSHPRFPEVSAALQRVGWHP